MAKTTAEKDVKPGLPRKASKPRQAPASELVPSVDFPQEGEEISAAGYAFRIGFSGDAREVEISVDDGPWLACRSSVGYWWHDFSGGAAGSHRASARARDGEGRMSVSPERVFSVRAG